MIHIARAPEPPQLARAREMGLASLRIKRIHGVIESDDFADTYRVVKDELWRMQYMKCCYCEHKSKQMYNDVEHFRPKTRADRSPGSTTLEGYWWLAWSWENLLFACSTCNRTEKNARFPLASADVLIPEEAPPGREVALLIDPAGPMNPLIHIRFVWMTQAPPDGPKHWFATPTDIRGFHTIDACGLNHQDLLDLRDDYANRTLLVRAARLLDAIEASDAQRVRNQFEDARDLLRADQPFAALAYDALTTSVPDSSLSPFSLQWPPRQAMPLLRAAR